MRIAVLGNCQSLPLVQCLRTMLPDHVMVRLNSNLAATDILARAVEQADIVIAQTADIPGIDMTGITTCLYPRFQFRPLAPDQARVDADDGQLLSPLGKPHSALAFFGWREGLDIEATAGLFREEIFAMLGYTGLLEQTLTLAAEEGARVGIADLAGRYERWLARGRFIHIVHHPRLFVMADIARAICDRLGLRPAIPNPEDFLHDPMLAGPIWALYPDIARLYGLTGGAVFKTPDDRENKTKGRIIDLREFIAMSFAIYDAAKDPRCLATQEPEFELLRDSLGLTGRIG